MMPEQQAVPKLSLERRPEEGRTAGGKRGTHIGIASVTALLLVLVIYFVSMPRKPEPQGTSKSVKTTAPVQKSAPQPENEPPLYLTVPAGKEVSAPFVYTVVKGDNLWNIAKRFSGNPLNYPRVAQNNGIATPDLIFPGQRIQIRNEPGPGR